MFNLLPRWPLWAMFALHYLATMGVILVLMWISGFFIKNVIPHMKKQGNGIIHKVSSAVGITGFKGIYGYSSTKGAIESLTKTLAIELEQYNIQVSLIHPPLMNTISAAPLGIPTQVMEDPEIIGKFLSKATEKEREKDQDAIV